MRRHHGLLATEKQWLRAWQDRWNYWCRRSRTFWDSLCKGISQSSAIEHHAKIVKALGADKIVAISRSSTKKADAEKMGAEHFIATNEDKDWAAHNANSIDLLISTVSSADMPLEKYLQLLRVKGTFVQVGAPEEPMPAFNAFSLIAKGVKIGGSAIGAPHEIEVITLKQEAAMQR